MSTSIPETTKYFRLFLLLLLGGGLVACLHHESNGPDLADRAKEYLRAVYQNQPDQISEYIAEDMVMTYPIFQELFGKPGFRGSNEVENFARGFNERWEEGDLVIHEALQNDSKIALVWSFSAIWSADTSRQRQHWGGITLLHFNESGQIIAEAGLENALGPHELLQAMKNR